jgi:hypothetical protein
MPSSRIIWNGNPGEIWVNRTEKFKYQLICNYKHSCGFCLQYDRAISNWWPVPFHRSCRCKNMLVRPGNSAEPFISFQEKLLGATPQQQTDAIGASNFSLWKRDVVTWDQIVTETRVRTLAEVVQQQKLSLDDLLKAGVRADRAEAAIARINTPKQQLIREHRQALIQKVLKSGISEEQLKKAVAVGIGQKITIAAGPSKASVLNSETYAAALPDDLRELLVYFGLKVRAMKPAPEPPKDKPDEPDEPR